MKAETKKGLLKIAKNILKNVIVLFLLSVVAQLLLGRVDSTEKMTVIFILYVVWSYLDIKITVLENKIKDLYESKENKLSFKHPYDILNLK
jgi:hypothetical protein